MRSLRRSLPAVVTLTVWSAVASSVASAQDGVAADPAPGADPLSDLVTSRATRWVWLEDGLPGLQDVVDVAVRGEQVALATRTGEVVLSVDGGASWARVLDGLGDGDDDGSPSEAALLDVTTRLQELIDAAADEAIDDVDEDVVPVDEAGETSDDEAAARLRSLVDDLQADATSDPLFREQSGQDADLVRAARPSLAFGADGTLWVGRGDGLWRLRDGSARRVTNARVDAAAVARDALWLIVDGLLAVRDLDGGDIAGLSIVQPTDGGLRALSVGSDGAIWVGADDGLHKREADGGWTRWLDGEPVQAVAAIGAAVLATPGGRFVRLDVAGRPTAPVGGGPEGVADIDVVGDAVLVGGREGAAVSFDGGDTFAPVVDGLPPSGVGAVALGPKVYAGTPTGLYRAEGGEPPSAEMREPDAFVPIELLLSAAERRVGMQPPKNTFGRGGRVLQYLLPQIRLEGRFSSSQGFTSRLDAGVDEDRALSPGVFLWVTWRPPARASGGSDLTVLPNEDGAIDVYGSEGVDAFLLAGRIGRRISEHKIEVAQRISDLYDRRQQIVQSSDVASAFGSLRAQVRVALELAEIEAMLDLLTDGAVGRWRTAQGG